MTRKFQNPNSKISRHDNYHTRGGIPQKAGQLNSKSQIPNRIGRLFVCLLLTMFALSNTSCRAQNVTPAAKQEAAPAKAETPTSDIVYLKVTAAKASSFDETPDWAPKPDAMAAFDRNMETRWASGYKDNQWLVLDFGKKKTVTKLIVKWEQAYATKFEILSSDDGENWTGVSLLDNQKGLTTTIDAGPVTCRYVKLLGLGRVNEEWGVSIWEFEAYGPADKNPDDKAEPGPSAWAVKKTSYELKAEEMNAKIAEGFIAPSPGPITKIEFQKGVNYTSWSGGELLTPMSDSSLAYLAEKGVGHIGLMVVRYMEDAAKKTIYIDGAKTVSDEALIHAINMIHLLGMKVMLKPHVDLADEDARTNILPSGEWFADYGKMIIHYAGIARKYNVELLCIGTELTNTAIETWRERWIDIIKEVRGVYKGPLTYAANWDDYDTVSFWGEMDFIGMDAYFPLTEKSMNPPREALVAGWTKHADTLEKWLKDRGMDKPVIFTEVGYDAMEGSNTKPWRVLPTLAKYKECQDEQANCLESMFEVLSRRAWFKGFYWWNYFPRPDLGPLGYTLRGKKGENILSEWFGKLD